MSNKLKPRILQPLPFYHFKCNNNSNKNDFNGESPYAYLTITAVYNVHDNQYERNEWVFPSVVLNNVSGGEDLKYLLCSSDGEMAKSSAATGYVVADKWSIERLN
uniref:Uncharacterized protein n=1 Tax=Glossina austeni TaxID=7395 RepID=A0A1A9UU90_GLOAU